MISGSMTIELDGRTVALELSESGWRLAEDCGPLPDWLIGLVDSLNAPTGDGGEIDEQTAARNAEGL